MYLNITFLLILTFLTACQTVTIRPGGGSSEPKSKANYEQVHDFFLWGLIGEKYINVSSICPKRQIKQIQTQSSFWNRVVYTVTLGIYSPRTAKVWCGGKIRRGENYLKYDKTNPKPGRIIPVEVPKGSFIDTETMESDIENMKANDSQLPQYEEPE